VFLLDPTRFSLPNARAMTDLALTAEIAVPLRRLPLRVARRRTFCHHLASGTPGKTTLTEKLLLVSAGAINLAGQGQGQGASGATPAPTGMKDRSAIAAISVRKPPSWTFEFEGLVLCFQPPGHHRATKTFPEDTLPHPDRRSTSAVMVIDAAEKAHRGGGRESCSRSAGCGTFPSSPSINKMDRESRDTFDLLDEIEKTLGGSTATPMTWPGPGGGPRFSSAPMTVGNRRACGLPRRPAGPRRVAAQQIGHRRSRRPPMPISTSGAIRDELALVCRRPASRSNSMRFAEGPHLTPVYFGRRAAQFSASAISWKASGVFAPPPAAARRTPICARVEAAEAAHEAPSCSRSRPTWNPKPSLNRIAFCALLLGQADAWHEGKNWCAPAKNMSLSSPQFFFAQESRTGRRGPLPGDVVGNSQPRHLADRRHP